MIRLTDLAATAALAAAATSPACAAEGSGSAVKQIYRCEVAGIATFSDRPCGSTVQTYEAGPGLSVLESPVPVPSAKAASRGHPVPPGFVATPKRAPLAPDARAEACRRLQQSLRKVAAQMRAGYKAKQGERLREQRRELEAKRRVQRC